LDPLPLWTGTSVKEHLARDSVSVSQAVVRDYPYVILLIVLGIVVVSISIATIAQNHD
jgi:hypothetical protein